MGPEAPPIEYTGPKDPEPGQAEVALAALYPASDGSPRFRLHTNSDWRTATFELPEAQPGKKWVRILDTHSDEEPHGNAWDPSEAPTVEAPLEVRARSVVVLQEVDV